MCPWPRSLPAGVPRVTCEVLLYSAAGACTPARCSSTCSPVWFTSPRGGRGTQLYYRYSKLFSAHIIEIGPNFEGEKKFTVKLSQPVAAPDPSSQNLANQRLPGSFSQTIFLMLLYILCSPLTSAFEKLHKQGAHGCC